MAFGLTHFDAEVRLLVQGEVSQLGVFYQDLPLVRRITVNRGSLYSKSGSFDSVDTYL